MQEILRSNSLGHVLLVDDDAVTRERVSHYLALNDYRVTPAENGKRMMEVLDDEPIDLVALELKLRGEDGLQLARQLRKTSRIPIIIVTSRAEEADRVMGLELGADDYITSRLVPANCSQGFELSCGVTKLQRDLLIRTTLCAYTILRLDPQCALTHAKVTCG